MSAIHMYSSPSLPCRQLGSIYSSMISSVVLLPMALRMVLILDEEVLI